MQKIILKQIFVNIYTEIYMFLLVVIIFLILKPYFKLKVHKSWLVLIMFFIFCWGGYRIQGFALRPESSTYFSNVDESSPYVEIPPGFRCEFHPLLPQKKPWDWRSCQNQAWKIPSPIPLRGTYQTEGSWKTSKYPPGGCKGHLEGNRCEVFPMKVGGNKLLGFGNFE